MTLLYRLLTNHSNEIIFEIEVSGMHIIWESFLMIGSIGFVAAIYFTLKLSRETGNERYWVALVVTALSFGIHQWFMVFNFYNIVEMEYAMAVEGVTGLVGAFSFAYATYGLYASIKRVRKRL